MTECIQSRFGFEACGSRQIVTSFDGGTISSDGGALLMRQTDKRLNLLPRLAKCFLDGRNQDQIEHWILEMLSQRVYGLGLGYEDLNDHEQLRKDPVFGVLAGRAQLDRPLAGKSTLNRMDSVPESRTATRRLRSGRRESMNCWSSYSSKPTRRLRRRSCWTWIPRICRCTVNRKDAFSMATTTTTAICRFSSSVESMCCARGCGNPITMPALAAW
jgi:hypothetical protein